MTTSGSVDFSVSRDDLIKAAMQHVGILGEGVSPSSTQLSEVGILLNMIVKARMSDGMPLWAIKTGYILPQTGVSSVSLGPSGGHATLSFTDTTTSAAAASGAGTIVVTSATGFTNGYNIGIELSDSTMQWTTISNVASTTITLTANLTGAVSSGAQVFVYQTKLQRPLRILDAYLLNVVDDTRQPISMVSRDEFMSLGSITTASIPNQAYYDPQLVDGIFHIYPRFLTGDEVIQITFHRPFEDFDAASDTPDFPQEWFLPLMLELAALLTPKAGAPINERKSYFNEAGIYINKALENGSPEESIRIIPRTE